MTHSRGRVGRRSPCMVAVVGVVVLSLGVTSCGGGGKKQVTAGLITKQETNPFFVTMRQVAEKTASDENVKLLTAAGTSDVDNQSQVAALEDLSLIHISEPTRLLSISYAVFCLKKKKKIK